MGAGAGIGQMIPVAGNDLLLMFPVKGKGFWPVLIRGLCQSSTTSPWKPPSNLNEPNDLLLRRWRGENPYSHDFYGQLLICLCVCASH